MNTIISRNRVYQFMAPDFGPVMHAKRLLSLTLATVGVCHSSRASIAEIGRSLASVTGKTPKHCIKQIDRLLSNDGVDLDAAMATYIRVIVGDREAVVLAMDWTEYPVNDQATVVLSLVTVHGRATPLAWRTVPKKGLNGRRNGFEDYLIHFVAGVLGRGVQVTVLADRAFGDVELYEMLEKLGWDYVIRYRGVIEATDPATGEVRPSTEWIPEGGVPHRIEGALLTQARVAVPAMVCVKAPKMKDGWCLATSLKRRTAEEVVALYARRFTIEETFRDEKDDRFGWGLKETSLRTPGRRDRMLFVLAMARLLLTLLGAAGEQLGLDKKLRANTVTKKRTHALVTQGRKYAVGVGVLASFAIPLLNLFHELSKHVPIHEFIGGPV
jgi:hypothetical protein